MRIVIMGRFDAFYGIVSLAHDAMEGRAVQECIMDVFAC